MFHAPDVHFHFVFASPSLAASIILKSQHEVAGAHLFALTMKRLFSPCTRLRDRLESQGRLPCSREIWRELNLDVSTEELLSAERAFTYGDLHTVLENTIAWLTPHVVVMRDDRNCIYYSLLHWGQLGESCRFCFNADAKHIVVLARSPEHLLEISDVVLRLLAASVVHSVSLRP
jgi:hypothetical protein